MPARDDARARAQADEDGAAQSVSVIIPVHNGARFLGAAIDSVLAQTRPVLDCIVVDDGSTDATPQVLAGYGEGITVISQTNAGVAAARNAGARRARGNVLAFLDADDVLLPEAFERQLAVLTADPRLALTYAPVEAVDEGGRRLGWTIPAPPPRRFVRHLLLRRRRTSALAVGSLVRRWAFDACGGFDERLSTSADLDLALRLALRFPIARTDEPVLRYRRHSGQMHRDLAAHERDHRVVLGKVFGPDGLAPARWRRSALAHLEMSLAAGWYVRGADHATVARYVRAAVRADPIAAGASAAGVAGWSLARRIARARRPRVVTAAVGPQR